MIITYNDLDDLMATRTKLQWYANNGLLWCIIDNSGRILEARATEECKLLSYFRFD